MVDEPRLTWGKKRTSKDTGEGNGKAGILAGHRKISETFQKLSDLKEEIRKIEELELSFEVAKEVD